MRLKNRKDVPEDVIQSLKDADSVLLMLHQKPDGDAMGSGIAMGKGLKQLGKEVDYYIDENAEPKVSFFEEAKNFNKGLKDFYDVILIMDCSSLDYSHHPEPLPDYGKLIVIDHHLSNENYGDENFVYETGATGELAYLTLKELGAELDDEMKEAIYTALSTDTGSFQYANTNDQTHRIAAALHELDYDFAPLARKLHHQKTIEQMKIQGKAIDNLELFEDGKVAVTLLDNDFIEEMGGFKNIPEDTANIGMNVDSVLLSATVKEVEPGLFRISFRSKSPYEIDVSKIALDYGGGGHYRASGGSFKGTAEELYERLIPELSELVKEAV